MKRGKLERLSMAIFAAVALLGGAAAKAAPSTDVSASTFVGNLYQYVQNGDITAALDALAHLKALGINYIRIGEMNYGIDSVMNMLSDPVQAKVMLASLASTVQQGVKAYFVAENRVIASVDWGKGEDLFPTGSAGH
jgi:hypothetical protein